MTISRIILTACCLTTVTAFAQRLELPAKSPGAKVTQTVGLTDITIEYSSPAVKGRKIWGGLVPLDTVWRAGANAATKITFSKPVTIDKTEVPAGSYGIYAIPGAKEWTLILNKELTNTDNYKKDTDLLRLTVKPAAIPLRERLANQITNFTDDAASIDL